MGGESVFFLDAVDLEALVLLSGCVIPSPTDPPTVEHGSAAAASDEVAGLYDDPALTRYVAEVGRCVTSESGIADRVRIVVLDSPITTAHATSTTVSS